MASTVSLPNFSYTLTDNTRINPNYIDRNLPDLFENGEMCVRDVIETSVKLAGNRNFLGSHVSCTSPYIWKTYSQAYERLIKLGSGLIQLKSLNSVPFKCVGIYGINCEDWLLTQYACTCYQLITVPLYSTLGNESMVFICNQSKLSVIICDTVERAEKVLELNKNSQTLTDLIVMSSPESLSELKNRTKGLLQVHAFQEILELGQAFLRPTVPSHIDDLVIICYTSGTTGQPKGVLVTNKMMMSSVNNNLVNSGSNFFTENDIYLSYLPMAHILEQMFILLAIFRRGSIGFYSGDPKKLPEDAQMLKPTTFTTVPRVLTRIYETVMNKLSHSTFRKRIFNKAMQVKCHRVDKGNYSTHTIFDKLIFSKIRAQLGGRIRWIVCGGAPLSQAVMRFCRAAFSCPIIEGYGSTETSSCMTASINSDIDGCHVGAPIPGYQIKLVDIPDMDIIVSRDKKGEICAKGICCTRGYYKNQKETRALIDSNGWLHTGDIGIWTEKNSLKIVDRCKNIFKLSQGEYVAPEKIELVYLQSIYVRQVFVDGDPEEAYPVAIVVPEFEVLAKSLTTKPNKNLSIHENGKVPTNGSVTAAGEHEEEVIVNGKPLKLDKLCKLDSAISLVLDDIKRLGKLAALKGFEQVQAVFLTPIEFTIENSMLTPTMKSARTIIRREFAPSIKELYRLTKLCPT